MRTSLLVRRFPLTNRRLGKSAIRRSQGRRLCFVLFVVSWRRCIAPLKLLSVHRFKRRNKALEKFLRSKNSSRIFCYRSVIIKSYISLRSYSSPDRSGKPGAEALCVGFVARTCSTTEQKAITHCFCEGCERSSKGYAEVERSGVAVAPNHTLLPLPLLLSNS